MPSISGVFSGVFTCIFLAEKCCNSIGKYRTPYRQYILSLGMFFGTCCRCDFFRQFMAFYSHTPPFFFLLKKNLFDAVFEPKSVVDPGISPSFIFSIFFHPLLGLAQKTVKNFYKNCSLFLMHFFLFQKHSGQMVYERL